MQCVEISCWCNFFFLNTLSSLNINWYLQGINGSFLTFIFIHLQSQIF